MPSPVAFHHWDLEMGKYLLQDTLEDVFSKDRQLTYLHIAVWWTQPEVYVRQQDSHPLLSWAVGHSGWDTKELFLYPLVFLNKFLFTKNQAPVYLLSFFLFCTTTVTICRMERFVLILNFHIFLFVFWVICGVKVFMLSIDHICIGTKILSMLSLYKEALEMKVIAKFVTLQINLLESSVV